MKRAPPSRRSCEGRPRVLMARAPARNLAVGPVRTLADIHPALAAQWHRSLNGTLRPSDVVPGSNKLVHWQCAAKRAHVWRCAVATRVRSAVRFSVVCPMCAGKVLAPENTLAAKRPDLAAQWHPVLNGKLKATDVGPGSSKRVWWKCPAAIDHEWETTIAGRTQHDQVGCPFCSNKRTCRSNSLGNVGDARGALLCRDFDKKRNAPLTVFSVQAGSDRKVWWQCAKKHSWQAAVSSRYLHGNECTQCSGRGEDLASQRPDLAAEWHPTKNGKLRPSDVIRTSSQRVWWRCSRDSTHVWATQVLTRGHANTGCPFCLGKRATPKTSVAALFPSLVKEWHPTKNQDLKPTDLRPQSNCVAWWRCASDASHEWQTKVSMRTSRSSGCPFCSGRRATPSTSLATLKPQIAARWHPKKNGVMKPADVKPGSNKRVWWKCANGPDHEWQAEVRHASRCPFCAGRRVAKADSLARRSPKIARDWDAERNGTLKPIEVHAASKQAVWWRCARKHSWRAAVRERTVLKRACPVCAGQVGG